MIGSFWNLCRACPSMPVDKLHSEYRSTYRWHEYTGNSRPEVVRRPPVPNQFGPINEPPLPRRKKCPELAYKSHEFIIGENEAVHQDYRTDSSATRARSEERGTPSRRSKSEGPPVVPNGRAYPVPYESGDVDGKKIGNSSIQAGESSGLFKKTISKLSTEYRLQFVWPHVRKAIKGQPNDAVELPRKSQSMGTIKSTKTNAMPTVNKKRTTHEKEATAYELEPLVNDVDDKKVIEKQPSIEKKFNRPCFTAVEQGRMNTFNTARGNFGFAEQNAVAAAGDNVAAADRERTNQLNSARENYGISEQTRPAAPDTNVEQGRMNIFNAARDNFGISEQPRRNADSNVEQGRMNTLNTARDNFGISEQPRRNADSNVEQGRMNTLNTARDNFGISEQPRRNADSNVEQGRMNTFNTARENFGISAQQNADVSAAAIEHEEDRMNAFNAARENLGFAEQNGGIGDNKNKYNEQWLKEVLELRKKADEYKCRGWGSIPIEPDIYKKQRDLWDQVSKRSSLSALSLASSIHSRLITKEEKDQENNKKSIPSKPPSNKPRIPGQAQLIDNKTISFRHHLERTTGPDVEEGALLPSPTREKLMPTIPKSKETDPYSSQKGSPKKSTASKHGSPQKGSPQKGSPKKTIKGRSQSVGPGVIDANESPKRQMRSVSTAPSGVAATKPVKKATATTPSAERRPRPSTLSTSIHSRSKSSSLPPSGRAHSAPGNHHIQILQNDTNKTSTASNLSQPNLRKNNKASKQTRPKSTIVNRQTGEMTESTTIISDVRSKNQDKELAENNSEYAPEKDGPISISSSSPQPPPEQVISEHIVKSPPEPTRVKSPEQIIMRSPDPVNWTVPLDTGKTFTVTQNVKEGESFSRPQSEVKASTPIERPPPAPQSAPPELAEQEKMEAWKSDISEPKTSESPTNYTKAPATRYDKPVPGSTLRCLDDPTFTTETLPSTKIPATDALEKARDRFDRFWGGNKEDNEDK